MTSDGSNLWLRGRYVVHLAVFCGLIAFGEVSTGMALIIGPLLLFDIYRDHRRRSTLRRREDGVYVWTEWHGGARSSVCDPTEDWDSEGDGDGGD